MDSSIDLDYEKRFMQDLIQTIKIFKNNLGVKIELTGILTTEIAKKINCLSDDLVFAGYYANIGLLTLEQIVSKPTFLSDQEKSLIKEHVFYSADFVKRRGLNRSAEIIKLHHEKGNGKGHFKEPHKDKDAAIVNIADEFIGLSCQSMYKTSLIKDRAIKFTIDGHLITGIFTTTEINDIKKILSEFHDKFINY